MPPCARDASCRQHHLDRLGERADTGQPVRFALHKIADLVDEGLVQAVRIHAELVGGLGRHNGDHERLPRAGERVEHRAAPVFVPDEIALAVLSARVAASCPAHTLRARTHQAADRLRDVDAVVEFVHAGRAEHIHDLTALLRVDRKELLHLVGIPRAGRAEDDRARCGQALPRGGSPPDFRRAACR